MKGRKRKIQRPGGTADMAVDEKLLRPMKFIKVTRSEFGGNYISPGDQIGTAIEREFEYLQDMEVGESFTLTVVEMTPADCEKLSEFEGW